YTLEMKPLGYLECKGFHPKYTPLQHLIVYSIAGGTPAYQHLFGDKNPEDVIRKQMFDHMSVFSLEAEGMVSMEAMSLGASTKVLAAISGGAESLRQISARTGLPSSFCTKVVEDMEHKGILGKEVSSGASRRAVYSIKSNILAFYYQVVYRYTHMVEFESPEEAYEMARKDIDAYMEAKFKVICMDYVAARFDYKFIGKLRRKDDTVDDVIDFLASLNERRSDRVLVARCRLYGSPMDKPDLDALMERARKLEGSSKVHALFSGCGFTPELQKAAAKSSTVRLISLDDLYKEP
ncbi:MAG: restriction endonuclease, partial [Thermoplasmata archaeon]|nr:restriction endonuclease [Thermoplasmata archaeon]